MYEKLSIEIKGMSPEQPVKDMIHLVAEKIHCQAPSDSCMKVVFEQSKEAIRASCRIVSHAGIFIAEAISEAPDEVIKQLEQKIGERLSFWKKTRFLGSFEEQIETAV